MIFSVVLYDAVAGGAGHVRRIVTADGQAFQRVLAKAISVVDNCDCDSSCCRCLRNYYIQNIHDNLNELMEEAKESPDPLELSRPDVKHLLDRSGVPEEKMEHFDKNFEEAFG